MLTETMSMTHIRTTRVKRWPPLDCIVEMSACPRDIPPINGAAGRPTEAHFQVIG